MFLLSKCAWQQEFFIKGVSIWFPISFHYCALQTIISFHKVKSSMALLSPSTRYRDPWDYYLLPLGIELHGSIITFRELRQMSTILVAAAATNEKQKVNRFQHLASGVTHND